MVSADGSHNSSERERMSRPAYDVSLPDYMAHLVCSYHGASHMSAESLKTDFCTLGLKC